MVFFMSLIIILPIFILLNNNPIYSLLALILTFINFSFVLFSLRLEFLALAYLIVYVGAICVLFIFVILLLNLRFYQSQNNKNHYIILSIAAFIIFLIFSNLRFEMYSDFIELLSKNNDLELFAISFFSTEYCYFILAGFLLLLAIIACIYLTLNPKITKKIKYYYF